MVVPPLTPALQRALRGWIVALEKDAHSWGETERASQDLSGAYTEVSAQSPTNEDYRLPGYLCGLVRFGEWKWAGNSGDPLEWAQVLQIFDSWYPDAARPET